jgi:hypothetical protein
MRSPFHSAAKNMFDAGWSVMPLMAGQKRPFIDKWTKYCVVRPDYGELTYWLSKPHEMNIGACLGEASGVMALDFDDDIDGLHEKILNIIPDSPLKKKGNKGFTAFYQYEKAIGSRGFSKAGVRVLDVLSDGRQTVMPPSIHPRTGEPYVWDSKTFEDIKISDLPKLTPKMFQDIVKFFKVEPTAPIKMQEGWPDPDLEEAAHTIQYIQPDESYDMWIHVGMALKEKFGEAAYQLWDTWSATGAKYKNSQETISKWRSFTNTGIGYGTIVMHAMSNPNFEPPWRFNTNQEVPDVIEPGGNMDWEAPPEKDEFQAAKNIILKHSAAKNQSHAALMKAPGLVGKIANWINHTSDYPIPPLAIAVALAATGTLMAHKIKTETGLRTNIYCAGLAPSGGGKNHGLKCVKHLLKMAGMKTAVSGKPKSSSALINGLAKRKGIQLLPWDEFGLAIESMNNARAGNHQREILSVMMELFSAADSTYNGDEYANADGKRPAIDIEQPNLCIYGASTEEQFYSSLSSKETVNGFLPRWLIFHSDDYAIDALDVPSFYNIPDDLLSEVKEWADHPTNADPSGNLAELEINPRVIPMEKAAKDLWVNYQREKRVFIAENQSYAFNAVIARAAEHAAKIALCAHEGDTISAEVMVWSIALSEQCLKYAIHAAELNLADNEHEANLKRLTREMEKMSRQYTKAAGWFTHTVLVQNTRWLTTFQRNELLQQLNQAEKIEVQKRNVKNARKPVTLYRIAGLYE